MPMPIKRTLVRSTRRNNIETIKMLVHSRLGERSSEEEEPFTSEKDDSSSSKSVHSEQSTEKRKENSCQGRTHTVKAEKTRGASQFSGNHLKRGSLMSKIEEVMSTFDKMSDYSPNEEDHEINMDEDGSITEKMLEIDEETKCKFFESFETKNNFITTGVKDMGKLNPYVLSEGLLPL